MTHTDPLPTPPEAALSLSRQLQSLIAEDINLSGGAISFERYMELALYAPGLGYYSAGSIKFGEHGDFVTAPELGSLFSTCLANQLRQVLKLTAGGDILELGGGSGVLAADLLNALDTLGTLPEQYYMLEPSAELRSRQQDRISSSAPALIDRVVWLDTLPDQGFEGVIVANEVMDAIPARRWLIDQGMLVELCVTVKDDRLAWQPTAPDSALKRAYEHITGSLKQPLPDGYHSEINLLLPAWIASLAGILNRGILLLIDYGYPRREYYHPQRATGTFRCHYRHRAHDNPFLWPGLQDMTVSVDFTAVAEAGTTAGLDLVGLTNQAGFLIGCGLEHHLQMDSSLDERLQLAQMREVRLLTDPSEMGERCKAIAFGRDIEQSLIGYSVFDQRARL